MFSVMAASNDCSQTLCDSILAVTLLQLFNPETVTLTPIQPDFDMGKSAKLPPTALPNRVNQLQARTAQIVLAKDDRSA